MGRAVTNESVELNEIEAEEREDGEGEGADEGEMTDLEPGARLEAAGAEEPSWLRLGLSLRSPASSSSSSPSTSTMLAGSRACRLDRKLWMRLPRPGNGPRLMTADEADFDSKQQKQN